MTDENNLDSDPIFQFKTDVERQYCNEQLKRNLDWIKEEFKRNDSGALSISPHKQAATSGVIQLKEEMNSINRKSLQKQNQLVILKRQYACITKSIETNHYIGEIQSSIMRQGGVQDKILLEDEVRIAFTNKVGDLERSMRYLNEQINQMLELRRIDEYKYGEVYQTTQKAQIKEQKCVQQVKETQDEISDIQQLQKTLIVKLVEGCNASKKQLFKGQDGLSRQMYKINHLQQFNETLIKKVDRIRHQDEVVTGRQVKEITMQQIRVLEELERIFITGQPDTLLIPESPIRHKSRSQHHVIADPAKQAPLIQRLNRQNTQLMRLEKITNMFERPNLVINQLEENENAATSPALPRRSVYKQNLNRRTTNSITIRESILNGFEQSSSKDIQLDDSTLHNHMKLFFKSDKNRHNTIAQKMIDFFKQCQNSILSLQVRYNEQNMERSKKKKLLAQLDTQLNGIKENCFVKDGDDIEQNNETMQRLETDAVNSENRIDKEYKAMPYNMYPFKMQTCHVAAIRAQERALEIQTVQEEANKQNLLLEKMFLMLLLLQKRMTSIVCLIASQDSFKVPQQLSHSANAIHKRMQRFHLNLNKNKMFLAIQEMQKQKEEGQKSAPALLSGRRHEQVKGSLNNGLNSQLEINNQHINNSNSNNKQDDVDEDNTPITNLDIFEILKQVVLQNDDNQDLKGAHYQQQQSSSSLESLESLQSESEQLFDDCQHVIELIKQNNLLSYFLTKRNLTQELNQTLQHFKPKYKTISIFNENLAQEETETANEKMQKIQYLQKMITDGDFIEHLQMRTLEDSVASKFQHLLIGNIQQLISDTKSAILLSRSAIRRTSPEFQFEFLTSQSEKHQGININSSAFVQQSHEEAAFRCRQQVKFNAKREFSPARNKSTVNSTEQENLEGSSESEMDSSEQSAGKEKVNNNDVKVEEAQNEEAIFESLMAEQEKESERNQKINDDDELDLHNAALQSLLHKHNKDIKEEKRQQVFSQFITREAMLLTKKDSYKQRFNIIHTQRIKEEKLSKRLAFTERLELLKNTRVGGEEGYLEQQRGEVKVAERKKHEQIQQIANQQQEQQLSHRDQQRADFEQHAMQTSTRLQPKRTNIQTAIYEQVLKDRQLSRVRKLEAKPTEQLEKNLVNELKSEKRQNLEQMLKEDVSANKLNYLKSSAIWEKRRDLALVEKQQRLHEKCLSQFRLPCTPNLTAHRTTQQQNKRSQSHNAQSSRLQVHSEPSFPEIMNNINNKSRRLNGSAKTQQTFMDISQTNERPYSKQNNRNQIGRSMRISKSTSQTNNQKQLLIPQRKLIQMRQIINHELEFFNPQSYQYPSSSCIGSGRDESCGGGDVAGSLCTTEYNTCQTTQMKSKNSQSMSKLYNDIIFSLKHNK